MPVFSSTQRAGGDRAFYPALIRTSEEDSVTVEGLLEKEINGIQLNQT